MTLIADINILNKKDIRKLSLDDLKAWLVEQGEKPFRAKQVYEWLWKHAAQSFAEMNNVSLPLREKLDQHFAINAVQVATQQVSNDPSYYGTECDADDGDRIANAICELIETEFPGIQTELWMECHCSSSTTGPNQDTVDGIDEWIECNWTAAL